MAREFPAAAGWPSRSLVRPRAMKRTQPTTRRGADAVRPSHCRTIRSLGIRCHCLRSDRSCSGLSITRIHSLLDLAWREGLCGRRASRRQGDPGSCGPAPGAWSRPRNASGRSVARGRRQSGSACRQRRGGRASVSAHSSHSTAPTAALRQTVEPACLRSRNCA